MPADKTSVKAKDFREGIFHFHPGDAVYRDHFPDYPVVPGSLIIHAFFEALKKAGLMQELSSIDNFKFREFLRPGRYCFRIETRKDRFYCAITKDNKTLVTGVMHR
jgi:3-hydroxyacyl-[acyl-carrier-protein] dehydratase